MSMFSAMYKLVYFLIVLASAQSFNDEEFTSEPEIFYNGKSMSIDDSSELDIQLVNIVKNIFDDNDTLPTSVDWRNKSVIPDVIDERNYYSGYGWAFSAIAGIESQYLINTQQTDLQLSAQNLIDCVEFTELKNVFNYMITNGTATEEDYPFTGGKGSCSSKDKTYKIDFYIAVESEDHLKNCIAYNGPVNVLIDASNLHDYTGGIVDNSKCNTTVGVNDLNQAVLVVGYGNENGKDYWIIQNSWGEKWGENGYLRLEMNANNTCGIGLVGIYPGVFPDL